MSAAFKPFHNDPLIAGIRREKERHGGTSSSRIDTLERRVWWKPALKSFVAIRHFLSRRTVAEAKGMYAILLMAAEDGADDELEAFNALRYMHLPPPPRLTTTDSV